MFLGNDAEIIHLNDTGRSPCHGCTHCTAVCGNDTRSGLMADNPNKYLATS